MEENANQRHAEEIISSAFGRSWGPNNSYIPQLCEDTNVEIAVHMKWFGLHGSIWQRKTDQTSYIITAWQQSLDFWFNVTPLYFNTHCIHARSQDTVNCLCQVTQGISCHTAEGMGLMKAMHDWNWWEINILDYFSFMITNILINSNFWWD